MLARAVSISAAIGLRRRSSRSGLELPRKLQTGSSSVFAETGKRRDPAFLTGDFKIIHIFDMQLFMKLGNFLPPKP
jgi:hypothetical protein